MLKPVLTSLLGLLLAGHTGAAWAQSNSDRITVTVRGRGPDMVLIPGAGCSNAVWEATTKELEGHYRLHLVQVAGFAGAPARANAKGPVLQPLVEALDAYLKTNRLKAPNVIGHSMGGLVALMLAAQHPEDTGKLMVVDAPPFFGLIMGAQDVAGAEPQAIRMRDMMINQTEEEYAQSERAFLPMLVKSPEGLKAATQWALASDKVVMARALYEVMTTDIRPKLPGIKTPVTVLYAWDAASGFPQSAVDGLYQDNYAALPHKRLVRIEQARHFIMLDQPEAFAKQVDAFLK